ncbi:hypothetical protein A2160_02520 [Candidatus Beckwithbacteria bacterium RBG_13_42_9]|uniref:Polysaccharide biosynthesis protein CapD-like domain-containing protein n=1 Tax=Candidatus Beckwithbacteria bacterium RBG_13_42_9 TaxID=1797457 RepID=A0A1F5E7V3_9BACT|nr:MAG: hypothetical protein A2160_02520 [Candidatus Beckwithbacteria bacterium RBG_13_42_9]
MYRHKTILITGGTGFLGLALAKAILKQNPQSIRLFSRDEVKHYRAQEYFNRNRKIRNFIGDVRDYPRLVKATRNVDYVIHAAALKRLDILEYNVDESIKTNIMGTLNLVNACLKNKVKKVVFISTDKACSPVNTYGACKFVSERIITESNYSKGDLNTIFTTVRYGNVLESTGSVIPFFRSVIKQGKTIPLTDPEMTRFIITSRQAVELISYALHYGKGGEIFIPQLPSFKILDLIEVLLKYFGTKNKIKIIGIRPGEKFHELMINIAEMARTIKFRNFYVINPCIGYSSDKVPLLPRKRTRVNQPSMRVYSSKDYIISKVALKKILQKNKII